MFQKYYQKSNRERIQILKKANLITEEDEKMLLEKTYYLDEIANQMIENQIATYEIPLGIVTNVVVNGKTYQVPLATEEPSVIAAASYSAATIAKYGGFTCEMKEKYLVGQIIFDKYDLTYLEQLNLTFWQNYAYEVYPSIFNRGGKLVEMYYQEVDSFCSVYVVLDTLEAMGANIMNTILEAFADKMSEFGFEKVMAILSNNGERSLVKASFKIEMKQLATNTLTGESISKKIVKANEYAKQDIYRATTHNKGIMNGITAAVLATGNDTRAIEAAVHSYALGKPLTNYKIENEWLIGEICVPLNLGTVGGSIRIHRMAKMVHQILGNPNAKQLAMIIAAIGLAQNFAALRALVSKGIQHGHMKLHYKSMILAAGATEKEVNQVLPILLTATNKNEQTIRQILQEIRKSVK